MLIGQPKLDDKLNNLTLDNLPQSLILLGDRGCGKHTLCSMIAQKLNMEIIVLDNKLESEDIDEIVNRPYPTLYVIDSTGVSPKFQNSLLKNIEEPSVGSYFIILCERANSLLPTLVNRCQQWVFQTYSTETLSQFIKKDNNKEIILELASTPGQVLEYQEHPLQGMIDLSNNILDRIGTTSFSTLLTITDRIAFKNEKDKFNLSIFLKVFRLVVLDKIRNSKNIKFISIYNELVGLETKLSNTISQTRTFENFLKKVWEVSR